MEIDDPILKLKLEELSSRLGANREPEETIQIEWSEGQSGDSVDWSQYKINPDIVHLYQRAKFIKGEWLYPYSNYNTINKPINKFNTELEDEINLKGWKLIHVGNNGHGFLTALLHKITVHSLPLPEKISIEQPSLFDQEEDINPNPDVEAWVASQKETNET